MSEEQRREKRAPLEVEVSLESENNFYSGITGNVSRGGVFIATYTPPPKGAGTATGWRRVIFTANPTAASRTPW